MGIAAQCGKDGGNKVTRNLGTSMINLELIVLALLIFPCSLPAQGVTPESNTTTGRTRSSENQGQGVNAEINESTKLAYFRVWGQGQSMGSGITIDSAEKPIWYLVIFKK